MTTTNIPFHALALPHATTAVMNRWWVVVGAIMIQLCLGAIYAWSVFTPSLTAAPFAFTATQTQWVFAVGLATFALVMVFAGKWQAKSGPTIVARVGGLVLGLGYVLAYFVGTSFPLLLLTIGVIGGAGIGLAYVVPIAVGVKWFPDKKGLITGLAVAGFGFGALVWVKLAGSWGHLIEQFGASKVFLFYGVIFYVMVTLGSLWMKNPPEGWTPPNWEQKQGAAGAPAGVDNSFEPRHMLGTPQFYMLWVMFIFGALAGLMVIGIIKLFGIDALQARSGMTLAEASATAGTAMAVFYAICNGLGRICWGALSDKIGRKTSLTVMMLLQGVMMLLFFWMGGIPALLFLGAAVIGFNFGGNFALFPAATADYFGNKNVGSNYGWMFTAYGVGGIVGPIMAGVFKDRGVELGVEAWKTPFIIAGTACLLAAVLGMMLKPPRPRESSA